MKLLLTQLPRCQTPKIDCFRHFQSILIAQFAPILVNPNPHKCVIVVIEEVPEGLGHVRGKDELEDEAIAANAELESGGGVGGFTAVSGRTTLNIKANE